MRRPMSYREAMCDLSDLAKDGPAYVRVKALVTIVRETSPNNARHGDVMRELGLADELSRGREGGAGCPNCGEGDEAHDQAQESLRVLRAQAEAKKQEEEGGADEEEPH